MKMSGVAILFGVSVAAAAYLAYRYLGDASPVGRVTVVLRGETFAVDLADTPSRRERGLSGRERLAADEGMLFRFDAPARQSFWMRGMKIPIDIVWIAGGEVAGVEEHAEPEPGVPLWRLKTYTSPEPVAEVLELVAGTVTRLGIARGDAVEVKWGER